MNIRTCIQIVMMLALTALVGGCGSGGSSVSSGKFVSKSTLGSATGIVSPAVKGIEITLVLPTGVTPQIDASTGQPVVTMLAPNNITASNGLMTAIYTPATGRIKLVAIRGDNPFTPGEFFSVACTVAADVTVSATDFKTEGLRIWDDTGTDITATSGATASIKTF